MGEPEDSSGDIVFDPASTLGVWANVTRVLLGRDEFVIDFVRVLPEDSQQVRVARALVPPRVGGELLDQLEEAWRRYSDWSMPGASDE